MVLFEFIWFGISWAFGCLSWACGFVLSFLLTCVHSVGLGSEFGVLCIHGPTDDLQGQWSSFLFCLLREGRRRHRQTDTMQHCPTTCGALLVSVMVHPCGIAAKPSASHLARHMLYLVSYFLFPEHLDFWLKMQVSFLPSETVRSLMSTPLFHYVRRVISDIHKLHKIHQRHIVGFFWRWLHWASIQTQMGEWG